METLKPELIRIADALESIAKSLQGNTEILKVIPDKSKDDDISVENNLICHNPWMLEEELFCKTVKVYLQETVRKDVENLKRKSGVKVSKDLIPMQINFMKK